MANTARRRPLHPLRQSPPTIGCQAGRASRCREGWWLPCLLAVVCLAGCSTLPYRLGEKQSDRSPRYGKIEIAYHRHCNFRPPANEDDILQVVDLSEGAALESPDSDLVVAELQIQYPHPNADDSLARATLRITQANPPTDGARSRLLKIVSSNWNRLMNPFTSGSPLPDVSTAAHGGELRVLDFPKEQLDLLVQDLTDGGFFQDQARPAGHVKLDVQIDRCQVSRQWTSEPRLDDFIDRVYREGERRPSAAQRTSYRPFR
jgi:hypothetical protein